MAIAFETVRLDYDPTSGQTQRQKGTAVFRGNVRSFGLAIGGWDMEYTNGDHHVLRQRIEICESKAVIKLNTVTFSTDFLLRDSSGNIDDPFKGYIDVLVIADIATGGVTNPN